MKHRRADRPAVISGDDRAAVVVVSAENEDEDGRQEAFPADELEPFDWRTQAYPDA